MKEKKLRELEGIAATIRRIAVPGMVPKALIGAVKELHPGATKKEIARAAFLTVINSAEFDPKDTQALHDLAIDPPEDDDGNTRRLNPVNRDGDPNPTTVEP